MSKERRSLGYKIKPSIIPLKRKKKDLAQPELIWKKIEFLTYCCQPPSFPIRRDPWLPSDAPPDLGFGTTTRPAELWEPHGQPIFPHWAHHQDLRILKSCSKNGFEKRLNSPPRRRLAKDNKNHEDFWELNQVCKCYTAVAAAASKSFKCAG